jgi:hypothetical protein
LVGGQLTYINNKHPEYSRNFEIINIDIYQEFQMTQGTSEQLKTDALSHQHPTTQGATPLTLFRMALMCSGVVPQHPATVANYCKQGRIKAAPMVQLSSTSAPPSTKPSTCS